MKLNNAPILRLFHLTINSKDKQIFEDEGVHNMTTSIKTEPGTLFMAATHADNAGTDNYVMECYKNAASYQVHANSPQFKHYGSVAKKVLTGRELVELTPQFILTKDKALDIIGQNDYFLRLIKLSLKEGEVNNFGDAIRKEMKESVIKEAGVKGMLAGSIVNKNNEWRILEIYENHETYNEHLKTDWFKDFTSETKDMISEVKTIDLVADTLVDQGKLEFN